MQLRLTLQGTRPLLMHNVRLVDEMDPATRALKAATAKRRKTDDDYEGVARLEFTGSLYLADPEGPYLPGENIERCLFDAAKMSRMGQQIRRGLIVTTDVNPLIYNGPRTAAALWADANYRHRKAVKVTTTGRVMRTRPRFPEWTVEADAMIDPSQLGIEDVQRIADTAGTMIGLGDYRPRYGRFTAEVAVL